MNTPSARTVVKTTRVVTLNWHDESTTVECVQRLTLDFEPGQIIVCDNESTGVLRSELDRVGLADVVVIEHAENRGFAGGMNPGLAYALGAGCDYVLAINNDVQYEPEGMRPLFMSIARDRLRGLAAPVVVDARGKAVAGGGHVRRLSLGIDDLAGARGMPFGFLTWACVVISSESLRALGGLDAGYFMYWEDVDFSERAMAAGFELRLVGEAQVTHVGGGSHKRAGPLISRYQAAGVVRYCRGGRQYLYPALAMRLLARFVRRLGQRDLQGAREVCRGARAGWSDKQMWLVLSNERGD